MSVSIFDSKQVTPDQEMLAFELGAAHEYYQSICRFIADEYGNLTPEWKFYGQKSSWILKLFSKKRNVLFLIPFSGFFKVAVTLGDKATDRVLDSQLPDPIKQELFVAQKYAEGRTIQLEVTNVAQCNHVLEIIRFKMA
jgi:hypothetical protein